MIGRIVRVRIGDLVGGHRDRAHRAVGKIRDRVQRERGGGRGALREGLRDAARNRKGVRGGRDVSLNVITTFEPAVTSVAACAGDVLMTVGAVSVGLTVVNEKLTSDPIGSAEPSVSVIWLPVTVTVHTVL